jgi:hypothetical protein
MAPLVARTMQHPVSAMAQISVFDVFTAGTVPPSYSGMQYRRTAGGGWKWTKGQDEDKVKSSRLLHVQSPISNLSRLAARLLLTKPPPNASANALRDFPTQLLSQLLLASASALATGPDEKAADRKSSWPAFLSLQVAQQLTVDTRQNDARLQGGEKVLRHRPAGRWHLGDQHPDLLGSGMLARLPLPAAAI